MKNLKMIALSILAIVGLAGCKENLEPATLTEVKLDLSAVKTDFALGEEFTSEGLKVVASYSDGTTKDLAFTMPEEGPNMKEAGESEIEVKYTLDGEEKTLTYNVNVWYWSEEELELQEEYSIFTANSYYPYMLGMKAEEVLDENEEAIGWQITMPNATEEDVDNYAELLTSYPEEVEMEDGTVYFELDEAELKPAAAEYYGVDPETALCYSLIPYYIDEDDNLPYRYYVYDEFIIIGLDEESNLIVTTRNVNAMFEAILWWPVTEGPMGSDNSAYGASVINLFEMGIQDYITKFFFGGDFFAANAVFPDPTISIGAVPFNLTTNYPFAFVLDDYDLAFGFEILDSENAAFDQFVSDLLAEGYVASEPDKDGVVTYTSSYGVTGSFEIELYPTVADTWTLASGESLDSFVVYYYFNAPTEPQYTAEKTAIEISMNMYDEANNYFYSEEEELYYTYYIAFNSEEEAAALTALEENITDIENMVLYYFMRGEFEMVEPFASSDGTYSAFFCDPYETVGVEVYIYVDSMPYEDTTLYCVFVDFYIYSLAE